MWHLYHTKRPWQLSLDGLLRTKEAANVAHAIQSSDSGSAGNGTGSWRLELPYDDGPTELEHRGLLTDYICRQAELGRIYIKKIGVDGNILQLNESGGGPGQVGDDGAVGSEGELQADSEVAELNTASGTGS